MQRQALEIFEQLLEIPPGERFARLEQLCPPDSPLRRDVEQLLAHDRGDDDGPGDGRADPPRADLVPGFVILGILGSGASGVVYRARQISPPREVALKVSAAPHAGAAAHRRHRLEVESLARLNHPYIAQVYAAGVLDGPPLVRQFIAMELVDGKPLDDRATFDTLIVRERVLLMVRICGAVDYAHQRGVVHRDLKPENILLRASGPDASGRVVLVPKVLDFGIARLLDPTVERQPTEAGFHGTTAWSAPERFDRDGSSPADVRADVYSLGVIAYELLSGRLPIDVRGEPIGRAIDRIRAEEPLPLGEVDPALRGDLACIVQKAMAKDPERRYPTAAEFARDLQRHLDGEPVSARGYGALHRAWKQYRRHRVVGTIVLVLAVSVAFGIASILRRWHDARQTAASLGAIAEGAIVRLEQLAGSTDVRVDVLDAMLLLFERIGDAWRDDASLARARASLLRGRGSADRDNGNWRAAMRWRHLGLEARQRQIELADDDDGLREYAIDIVLVGDADKALGNDLEGLAAYERAHELFARIADSHPGDRRALDDLACSFDRIVGHHLAHGEIERAVAGLDQREAINARLLAIAPEHPFTLLGLAHYHDLRGRCLTGEPALEHYRLSVDHARRLFEHDKDNRLYRRTLAMVLGGYAASCLQLGHDPDGDAALEEAHGLFAGLDPQDELLRLQAGLCNSRLAERARARARYADAMRYAEKAHELMGAVSAPLRSPHAFANLVCAARVALDVGDEAAARSWYERARAERGTSDDPELKDLRAAMSEAR